VSVSVPTEVEDALGARAGRAAVGDVDAYRQYQLGRATPVAAANPAGGLAAAGVGLGMGIAYAEPARPAAPAVPGWHVAEQGRSVGPLEFAALAAEIARGRVSRETLVSTAGMAAWEPAAKVAALQALSRRRCHRPERVAILRTPAAASGRQAPFLAWWRTEFDESRRNGSASCAAQVSG
jgi:membrane protease subunit (stomatin/prohibitin family)